MALATISVPPADKTDLLYWTQAHALHHYDCVRVAQGMFPTFTFGVFPLDPMDPDALDTWLNQHQQMHQDMNKALGTAGYDLTDLFWDDNMSVQTWFAQNFTEHQQWGTKLNLG